MGPEALVLTPTSNHYLINSRRGGERGGPPRAGLAGRAAFRHPAEVPPDVETGASDAVPVSALVWQKAAHRGEEGEKWLAGLGKLIVEMEAGWGITVGQAIPGGSTSFVARARTQAGRDVVLKLAFPDRGFADEVRTLSAARGLGLCEPAGR